MLEQRHYLHCQPIACSIRSETVPSQLLKDPRHSLPLVGRNTCIQNLKIHQLSEMIVRKESLRV